MLIELSRRSSRADDAVESPIVINTAHVVTIEPRGETTSISVLGGERILVSEDYDQVLDSFPKANFLTLAAKQVKPPPAPDPAPKGLKG
jgi:uncharacterized protein YlzI (FlbEa/FlbD family)